MDNEQERYERARRRIQTIRTFYIHTLVFICTNVSLFGLNMLTSPEMIWYYWATFGWGLGLFAHGASVFIFGGIFSPDWEERKIHKIMVGKSSNRKITNSNNIDSKVADLKLVGN